ncbi:MAG: hypothetical protein ABSF96_10870 [Steroidobacteraceae bacterium]|jgi:hypothetical protein
MKASAGESLTPDVNADIDAALERVRVLPETEALEFYSQLSSRQQWLVRLRATGRRREAMIIYHAVNIGPCGKITLR